MQQDVAVISCLFVDEQQNVNPETCLILQFFKMHFRIETSFTVECLKVIYTLSNQQRDSISFISLKSMVLS